MSKITRYNVCDSAVFCALHDQLASLCIHAQLTPFFSAVAVLLVLFCRPIMRTKILIGWLVMVVPLVRLLTEVELIRAAVAQHAHEL